MLFSSHFQSVREIASWYLLLHGAKLAFSSSVFLQINKPMEKASLGEDLISGYIMGFKSIGIHFYFEKCIPGIIPSRSRRLRMLFFKLSC